jgi:hypothetical protein
MADKSIGQYNETVSTDNNDEYLIQRTGRYFKIKYSNFVPPAPDLSNLFENGGNLFGANAFLGTTDNFNLSFITNSVTRATFDTSGNFGLGVTAAAATRLHIKGAGSTSSTNALRVDSSTVDNLFVVRDDGRISANDPEANFWNRHWIYDPNDLNENFKLNFTTAIKFFFDGYGNTFWKQINGVGNSDLTITAMGGGNNVLLRAKNRLSFSSGDDAPQALLSEAGNLFIGPWTSGGTNATSRLHLKGANGYTQLRLEEAYTPTSTADANGATGDVAWDADYIYIKTAAGWKRSAITTF